MSTVIEDVETDATAEYSDIAESQPFTSEFAQNLRDQTAAVRLMHSRLGVRRALSHAQVQEAAGVFGSDADYLSASKRLIDTHDEVYKAVTGIISRSKAYWQTMTVPFPIKGIRLIRKDLVPNFNAAMLKFREELDEAVELLSHRFESLRLDAQQRLGALYNSQDYPSDVHGLFRISWDYPNVEPPSYLKELNPELYEQQAQLVQARFEEALVLAEEAFTAELQGLVSHLVERLSDEGTSEKPKVFRNTAVENLQTFFEKFRAMNVRSNGDLNALVTQAEQIIKDIDPKDLRKKGALRLGIAEQMTAVKAKLDTMVVEAPTRAIDLED